MVPCSTSLDYKLTLVLALTVFSAASKDFSSPPTTVKALKNNTVLLPCYLNTISNDGAQVVSVRWYKDKELLVDSANESVFIPARHYLWSNGSLEIQRVEPGDTAEYICEIFRPEPWGPVRQRHAIEVLHPPSAEPFPVTGFLQVKLGEEVRMSCKGGGVPYPIITWSRKGEELKLIDNRELLVFTATDRSLAGVYQCKAENGVGEPAKASIELSIIYPPELQTTRSWVHTAPGYRTQLECRVSADPQASVTWLKGEVPVRAEGRIATLIEGEKHILLIKQVQRSDFGIYTCRAINKLGQGEIQIQLSGVPHPGVFKKTSENDISPNEHSYTLIWEVDSYTPIVEYSLWFRPYKIARGLKRPDWTKLTIPAEHSSGPVFSKSFTLKDLKEKTIYEALIVSRNRYGWSKPSPILRFATAGAEFIEDMITTVQLGQDENVVPLDLKSGSSMNVHVFLYFIVNLFLLNVIY